MSKLLCYQFNKIVQLEMPSFFNFFCQLEIMYIGDLLYLKCILGAKDVK